MCEPTTIMMGIAAVSAASGLYVQQQAADAQESMNSRQTTLALQARADNSDQVGLMQQQQHDLASQKINDYVIQTRDAQGTYIAQGDTGMSVDAMMGDIGGKGAKYNSSVEQNLASSNMALDNQMRNVNTNAANTIAGLKTPTMPDYLGTALKIGGSAYGEYTKAPGVTLDQSGTNLFAGQKP